MLFLFRRAGSFFRFPRTDFVLVRDSARPSLTKRVTPDHESVISGGIELRGGVDRRNARYVGMVEIGVRISAVGHGKTIKSPQTNRPVRQAKEVNRY